MQFWSRASCNFKLHVKTSGDLSRDVAEVSNRMELGSNFWENTANRSKCRARIAQKSPLIYTRDRSCNEERDKNRMLLVVSGLGASVKCICEMKLARKEVNQIKAFATRREMFIFFRQVP